MKLTPPTPNAFAVRESSLFELPAISLCLLYKQTVKARGCILSRNHHSGLLWWILERENANLVSDSIRSTAACLE